MTLAEFIGQHYRCVDCGSTTYRLWVPVWEIHAVEVYDNGKPEDEIVDYRYLPKRRPMRECLRCHGWNFRKVRQGQRATVSDE
jgi:hypothetical protein